MTISTVLRRPLNLAVALLMVATACGGGGESADDVPAVTPAPDSVSAQDNITIPIAIDGRPDDFSTSLLTFFPSVVEAHAGDTVKFTSRFGGEPHTVALGTLVDAVLAPTTSGGQPSAEALAKLPKFFDNAAPILPLSEPLQAGGQPCFVETGDPPTVEPCSAEQQEQPEEFTGRQAVYSSGFLPDEETFSVKLADDIAPGVYNFMCVVHGASERGSITVVPDTQPVASPEQVTKLGKEQFDAAVAALRPEAEAILAATSTTITVGADADDAGLGFTTDANVFPEEVSVPTGGTVTWSINHAHTVSFNSPEDARPLYLAEGDRVRINRKGADPANSPGQVVGGPLAIDGGTFDGTGFKNSGLLVTLDEAAPVTYSVTFTKPGTYKYRCNFHLDMEGTIKVG